MTVGMSYGSDLLLFEQANNVEIVVDFLQHARQADGNISVPRSALIIGGDMVMDVANTLKILDCLSVTCVESSRIRRIPCQRKRIYQHTDIRSIDY